ncbi:sensor histidine kinase [Bacteroides bouchesdurhonensis]|uniref:sensor histidine kinase n=1 Tax=Bacteroides bouchesdurhonensis TaxID=1841855 RepID=UPI0022E4F20C|nr:HAMP domain-containing sensor histidine kinase [Bacteroides bouchesdurhonensis]
MCFILFRYNYVLSEGHTSVVTGLLQNIQEIKDRETELIEARNIAEQAELKQSFLNNMSHEIRTPLNAIVGFSSILADTLQTDDEEIKEYVNIINVNTELLLNLVNDILELSRIDSGVVSFIQQDKNVRTLLESYYRTFHVQVKPGLEFLCDFPEEDYTVSVDPMRLQQVVTNFLSNANKFTESGYIRLGYRYIAEEDKVSIFVEDTGKGIPKNELEMIFSRFYKRDEFAQGTGLGLAICQGIVLRLHGQIRVESEVGKGSRFSVLLPAVVADGVQSSSVWQKPAS